MIELNRHIEILLLSNDCVIVPDLGGFMAHHVEARYDHEEHVFLPPLRTLGFNPRLKMNDSLLVQSYIEAYDISYPEALRRIQAEVTELKQHLEAEGEYSLTDIGTLAINSEGNITFEPCEAGILTPQLYGLGTVEIKQRVKREEKKEERKDTDAITIKMSWLRNAVAAAAAIAAFLMLGTPITNSQMSTTVQQSAFLPLGSTSAKAEATPSLPSPSCDPAVASEQVSGAERSGEPSYCIVMASQVSRRNAEDFIARLDKKGFDKAYILESKFRRVVYGSYPTVDEASAQLRSLRSQSSLFRESWVMEIK